MKELIIHVGPVKTGTTALQHALYKTSTELKSRGINYPNLIGSGFDWIVERGMGCGNADTNANYEWSEPNLFERFKWLLYKAFDSSKEDEKIVLSSEHLSRLAVQEEFWRILARFIRENNCNVKIVSYLRDPFSMFLSCYKQYVKENGYFGTLGNFVSHFVTSDHSVSFIFQRNIEKMYNFSMTYDVQFETNRYEDVANNIAEHFFSHFLGISLEQFSYNSLNLNRSLTLYEIEFHRGINSVSPKLGRLLGFERTDVLISGLMAPHNFNKEPFVASFEEIDALKNQIESYREISFHHLNFADKIYFDIDESVLVSKLNSEQELYRNQIYDLGKFVAMSFSAGYIQWHYNL